LPTLFYLDKILYIMSKAIKLKEVAHLINAEIIGSSDKEFFSIKPIEENCERSISFLLRRNEKSYLSASREILPVAIIIENRSSLTEEIAGTTLLKVDNPLKAISKIATHFFPSFRPSPGISDKACVVSNAKIGHGVHIGAFCSVGEEAEIGDDVVLFPNVTVYPRAKIGARTVVHAGAVIREGTVIGCDCIIQAGVILGGEGFGYFFDSNEGLKPVPQIGNVVIEDGVDVGANACIDRATFGSTIIGKNTKIDNLAQIGHNVKIGRSAIICGLVGIAGSSKIGNGVTIGGHSGVADHVNIVDGARFAGKSGIPYDITVKGDYAGFPATPAKSWHRQISGLQELPELIKKMKKNNASK
jgi:UDP-3-O-[3-hydroxymyristoyl] glucosamine N-acyltransferase